MPALAGRAGVRPYLGRFPRDFFFLKKGEKVFGKAKSEVFRLSVLYKQGEES